MALATDIMFDFHVNLKNIHVRISQNSVEFTPRNSQYAGDILTGIFAKPFSRVKEHHQLEIKQQALPFNFI